MAASLKNYKLTNFENFISLGEENIKLDKKWTSKSSRQSYVKFAFSMLLIRKLSTLSGAQKPVAEPQILKLHKNKVFLLQNLKLNISERGPFNWQSSFTIVTTTTKSGLLEGSSMVLRRSIIRTCILTDGLVI